MNSERLSEYIGQAGSRIAVTGLQADITEFLATLTITYSAGYTIEGDKLETYLGVVNFLHYPQEYFAACEQVAVRYGLDWREISQECVCVPWHDLETDANYMFLARELSQVQHILVIDLRGLKDEEIKGKLSRSNKHAFVNGNCRIVYVMDLQTVADLTFYREMDLTVTVVRNASNRLVYQQVVGDKSKAYWPSKSAWNSPLWIDTYA